MNRILNCVFLFSLLLTFGKHQSFGQDLSLVCDGFSKSKQAYVLTQDSVWQSGFIKSVQKKNGFIVSFKWTNNLGKQQQVKSEDILGFMAYPNQVEKLGRLLDFIETSKGWKNPLTNEVKTFKQKKIEKGYCIYHTLDIPSKGNSMQKTKVLMQLLNPTFCELVHVFYDPKSTKVNYATTEGKNPNAMKYSSYYTEINENSIISVSEENYSELAKSLWNGCDSLSNENIALEYIYFVQDLIQFTQCNPK